MESVNNSPHPLEASATVGETSVELVTIEPKAGWKTTEFWVTVLATAGSITGGLAGVLPEKYAALAAAISSGAYAISRGLAKQRRDW